MTTFQTMLDDMIETCKEHHPDRYALKATCARSCTECEFYVICMELDAFPKDYNHCFEIEEELNKENVTDG